MAKFKNTIGAEFPKYIKTQLSKRAEITEKKNRNSKDLLWLTNRTGWYKVTSGALINKKDTLARNNILQGGIVKDAGDGSVSLREGFNSSYINTGELGLRPMPNISSISVGTGGRWQTLLQAEITIEAYDLAQLDIISKLYMSLGVHIFVEWGHAPYVDNSGAIQTTTIRPIDFFQFSGPSGLNDKLLKEISRVKSKYDGNYEALIGRVYNFDYNSNPDGSYTCKIKVMGAGAMADSLRGISNLSGEDTDATPDDDPKKYGSDLEVALTSIKNVLNNAAQAKVSKKSVVVSGSGRGRKRISLGEILRVGGGTMFETYTSFWGEVGNVLAGSDFYTNPSYGTVLNEIYGNSNYKSLSFINTNGNTGVVNYAKRSTNFSEFGNASQIIHQIDGNEKYGLDSIPTSFYDGFTSTLTYEKIGTFFPDKIKATYITLGHLFCLVQHLGIFVVDSGEPQPAIYLDYHPDNTIVRTGTIQASIDPSICLVPFEKNRNMTLGLFLNPLDPTKTTKYSFQEGTRSNNSKNFSTNNQLNRVNGNIPSFNGKLFNILINVDFAIETLQNLKNAKSDKISTLREYLDNILAGVNRALGGINDFKLNFVDCSQTLRVIDQNYVPDKIEYFEMPVFGLKSIAYDYNYSSKISKELASQIVIASQASSQDIKDYPDDVLSYFKLNGGVTDRFTPEIKPPCIEPTDEEKIQALRAPQSLFDQLYNSFSLASDEPISTGVASSLINYYNTLQIKYINKKGSQPKQSILVPLEMSITIDGLGGILPYNAFLLPNNRLPKRYRNRVAFIVFSINHKFENNQWLTELRGQTIIRPEQSF